ncbi:MBL fold metallo-hydrolase [Macrococcoides canis]|uniref:MBL fold metallo-hydrolase n=1 Tax=Macrococcoides canis TaxID=1855823 RepID=A0A4R6C792_9STAP|nr:MBL fold metallo-hydrolase [Macrococcus canis]MEE1106688.1 MBL fold metallo-hydrolase [Macrococcus canis]TDM18386.1 MBL fold metallo-hydrolase [Macrococcus canis]TDM21568.1 MBL fold metallo-hydrolase [Macrococcus canis]TDM23559.1 MBL fold metallo-hydrolase [Macrococcus canis]TDM31708.1 MBL fold metallo-hydrolase [Macrococcus canis]
MKKKKIALGMIETNCYILENEQEILIVDPGSEPERLIETIGNTDKKVSGVLLTHAHFDHIGAVDAICSHYQCALYMSQIEKYFLTDPLKNGSEKFRQYGIEPVIVNQQPKYLDNGVQQIGTFSFEVRHTPGHSPGSLSFIFKNFAIVGDTLFKEGIGRTDLYQGDTSQLLSSIDRELFSLDEACIICPGHGPETTVGYEKVNNPYL